MAKGSMNAALKAQAKTMASTKAQPASCPGMRKRMAPAGASINRKMTNDTPHMMTASQTAFLTMTSPFWA
ncbi:hypothetical protein B5V02_25280 [Mesorhizobium kowhaii]|uniref:Uncharacterized protein n=1 Tax=Mesorhizobium kowhaii TaxID=1300272 RepID=A0A2W7CFY1_9HYPH|nr:hypothetical protein B5V02_25280 [Mesorhizobium kowhaii]